MTERLAKVLFLDIDGVLNTMETEERFKGVLGIDRKLLGLFRQIDKTTVVLSSTWRLHPAHLQKVMSLVDIHDCTPVLNDSPRHKEIAAWLEQNQPDDFVILDDDPDAEIEGHFFRVLNGLTPELVQQVNERLRNGRDVQN